MGELTKNSSDAAFGLSQEIIASLRRVFSEYSEVERVLIFGSRAKGTFRDGSDIDLAVLAPTMSDERFSDLWNAIDDLPIVFKTDVLHFDRLRNIPLKEAALGQGVRFFP
jgi:predicted nucleotidyltransferase